MFAGHDTTATSIMFTLYALAANPKAQQKVQEELKEIFGDDAHRPVTNEDMGKMTYLHCCLKEAMRIYTTVPAFSRTSSEELIYEVNH